MCLSTDDMYTTDTFVVGVDGHLPSDVQALYPSSTGTSTPVGGDSSSNKVPVIVGSVIDCLAAIDLIAALILFRHRLFRKKAADSAPGSGDGDGGGPGLAELDTEESHKLPRQEMVDSSPGDIEDLERAIGSSRRAATLTARTDPSLGKWLTKVAYQLELLYGHTGNIACLREEYSSV
ncbi:hypothetical protein ISF_01447 [Cordyceps fumosorosea ARSEF 2679]|uniref:Uncharacterized protein n=1 Tax=Cordyceps fumosorosea (strain ARSEF 2679) TaxID=1081104 RepID=A0A162LLH6_CORFA|nr:hypothetical protein ISF_01447 [Cordyceps fumosorosea ARSEF 2679]OAA72374.1 hypothetical protein ISF_01447 [Cordyceps fumosorosea ARSEF 2679]